MNTTHWILLLAPVALVVSASAGEAFAQAEVAPPTQAPEAEPGVEPAAELGVEPAAEPGAEPAAMPGAEPAAEPGVEPAAMPAAEAGAEHGVVETLADARRPLIADDVAPNLTVYARDGVALRVGGLLQVHAAPYVGDDALVTNDDSATSAGFRLRRARFGIEALLRERLRLLLVINPLESDPDVGTLSDAQLTAELMPWLSLSVGTGKVPFTRGNTESSASLPTIERPLSVLVVAPDNRLGATVHGEVLGGRLAYAVAFMNATEGYELGNQFGGFLYAGRLVGNVWRAPDADRPGHDGVAFGMSGFFEDGPTTSSVAASADLTVAILGASMRVEGIYDRTTPDDAPASSPEVTAEVERMGAYVELGYVLPVYPIQSIQPLVRVEVFDDNADLDDAGDALLVSAGVNARPTPRTRVQLHYLHRNERYGATRANDTVVLNLQGEL